MVFLFYASQLELKYEIIVKKDFCVLYRIFQFKQVSNFLIF